MHNWSGRHSWVCHTLRVEQNKVRRRNYSVDDAGDRIEVVISKVVRWLLGMKMVLKDLPMMKNILYKWCQKCPGLSGCVTSSPLMCLHRGWASSPSSPGGGNYCLWWRWCDGDTDGDGDGDNDILYIFIFHCRQESKLLIRDIQQDDLGNYGCFAENEVRTYKKLILFRIFSSFSTILDVSEIANNFFVYIYLLDKITQLQFLI